MSDEKSAAKSANHCAKCKHEHTGKKFAYICIGCPCLERPGEAAAAKRPMSRRAQDAAARKVVVGRILAAWQRVGYQRLGQLLVNACQPIDVFNIEDEDLAAAVEMFVASGKEPGREPKSVLDIRARHATPPTEHGLYYGFAHNDVGRLLMRIDELTAAHAELQELQKRRSDEHFEAILGLEIAERMASNLAEERRVEIERLRAAAPPPASGGHRDHVTFGSFELYIAETLEIVIRKGDRWVSLSADECMSAVEQLERMAGYVAEAEPRRARDEPKCPGPDCVMCNGEACNKCGAGLRRSDLMAVRPCEHDVVQRHEEPER